MSASGRGPVHRPALSRCIRVEPDEFATEYWGMRPLLSEAATLPAGYDDLFTAASVDELISQRGLRTPFMRMAREGSVLPATAYTASGGFGAEVGDQVSSDKVLEQFAQGATIVLQGLHRTWPPLIDFTRRLVDDLGHPAQVNAYITPSSSQGFDPHYDTHDVFVLQISGEKHWRIHAPVHIDPLRDQPWGDYREQVSARAEGEPVIDAVLRPGDALYLPRGWIHSATALGETSVHLTIGMAAYTRADVVETLLDVAGRTPALRASLPLGIDLSDAQALSPVVREIIADLHEALENADLEGPVSALRRRFQRATRPEPVAPVATIAAAAALSADTRVRWRGSLATRLEHVDGRTHVITGLKTLSMPIEAQSALERLVTGEPVEVGALPGLDLDSALVVVRRLMREGFVVV